MTVREEFVLGGAALDALLGTLPVNIEKNIMRGALRAGAKVFMAEVKNNIPISSGDLRNSVRITTRSKKGQVTASVKIGNKRVYYAQMVEFGTRAHFISVQDSERGVNRRTGKALSMRTINRNSLIIGNTFVGPTVSHPGARPRPYARPAAEAGFQAAVGAVQLYVRQRLTKAGLSVPENTPAGEAEE